MNRLEEIHKEGEAYLIGSKSPKLFENLVEGSSGYRGMAHHPKDLREHLTHGKNLLGKLRRAGGFRAIGGMMEDWAENDFEKIRTLMHLVYMQRSFGHLGGLSSSERGTLDQVVYIMGMLIQSEPIADTRGKISQIFADLRDTCTDPLAADTAYIHCAYSLWYAPQPEARAEAMAAILAEGFSDTKYPEVCRHFGFKEDRMAELIDGKKCLEVGPGFSDFSSTLRDAGADIWTIDPYPIGRLMEKMMEWVNGNKGILLDDPENCQALYAKWRADPSSFEGRHAVGVAGDIPRLLGVNRFDDIFAHDSLLQIHGYLLYPERPAPFFESIIGILQGLSRDGGTFHASTRSKWNLYAPYPMQRFMMPFILSLVAGGFEVVDAHDDSGEFSWEKFIPRYTRWAGDQDPHSSDLHIRRHSESDVQKTVEFINAFLPRRTEEDALASVCRDWPHH